MRRLKTLKFLIVCLFMSILLIYILNKSNNESWTPTDSIESVPNVKEQGLEDIFEDERQNKLYAKYRPSPTLMPKHKRYLFNLTSSRRRNGFYLITEYTPVFGQAKYCRLKKDEKFLQDYVR